MRAVDIIMDKRAGKELSPESIAFLIEGYTTGVIPAYQMAAWAMAVCFQGMSAAETAALTTAMLHSGSVMTLSKARGPLVDKHSTGGVGDKTSLILAPLAAAMGLQVPMMAGRALGHTGGTLDKLDSIPGYQTSLTADKFCQVLTETGYVIAGQTADLVPADRLLYALRDVTGTVESIPLITASILSKKAAEGAQALVLDVKYGSGAFMKTPADAERLAQSLVDTGAVLKMHVTALLTDMDEPLGAMTGNFLEVEESFLCLEGKGAADMREVSLELGARMAVIGGKAATVAEGRQQCADVLASGRPRSLFLKNIEAQGGNPDAFLRMIGVYRSPVVAEVLAAQDGYVARIDAGAVGRAGVGLGIGRNRTEDPVSPTAGIQFHRKHGDPVRSGDRIMTVWGVSEAALAESLPRLAAAVTYTSAPPPPRQLIGKEITP